MTIQLSSASQTYLEERVASGRFSSTEEAVEEAVRFMQERERKPGQDLIDAMQACPVPDFNFEREPIYMQVREPIDFSSDQF